MQQLELNEMGLVIESGKREASKMTLTHKFHLWFGVLEIKLNKLKASNKETYEQLMLLELDAEKGDKAAILERIAKIKGILSVLMLALVLTAEFSGQDFPRVRGRGRRRDDIVEVCVV